MSRIIDAFEQYFDDNGDPLVDGFLRFTESGTNNTDKDTFADVNETIANTNPVALSGAGRCPNVFGTGSYKVRSYDSNMQQIQEFDPVGGDFAGQFSSWNSATIYGEGDLVIGSDGLYYRSLSTNNQNQDPTTSADAWENVQFLGVWNVNISYADGDLVIDSSGHLYSSLAGSNLNNIPADNPDKWGDPTNISDLTTVTLTHDMGADADYSLTVAENLDGRIIITDAGTVLTGSVNIIVSDTERTFFAKNDTLQTLTFKTAAGTGISVLSGDSVLLLCDGVNVIEPVSVDIPEGTPIATTSGTSHDFTGIPNGTKKITISIDGVSTNGTSVPIIQIGDSGGIETTGYKNIASFISTTNDTTRTFAYTQAFALYGASVVAASSVLSGQITLSRLTADVWTVDGSVNESTAHSMNLTTGSKTLTETLDRVRLTTVNGTDVFDAGSFNILYE